MARTWVITGSASGIGAATRARLERHGHRVIGVDRHDAEVVADLSTAEGRTAMVQGVRSVAGGSVDAVIAGAGIAAPEPVTVSVNYFGAVATLEGLRSLLAAGTEPRAVAIASVASVMSSDDAVVGACLAGDEPAALAAAAGCRFLAYTSSKTALSRWVRRRAVTPDWAGAGIPLNAVAPGVVTTPMTAALLATAEGTKLVTDSTPMPIGSFAAPEQIAPLLEFLTSPVNTHVVGQVVFVDGGTDAVLRGDSTW